MKFLKTPHHSHHSFPGTGCGECGSHVPDTGPFAARGWEAEPKPTGRAVGIPLNPRLRLSYAAAGTGGTWRADPSAAAPAGISGSSARNTGPDVCPQDGSGC